MDEQLIIPGVGFGRLKFGMQVEDVVRLLGSPEEEGNPDEDGDIIYRYNSKGIMILSFTEEDDFRLTMIELNVNSNSIIWGTKIFDKSFLEISKISSELGYSLSLVDRIIDEELDIYQNLYVIEPLDLDFYFDRNEKLSEISMSVYYDTNDEVKWPG